jgi:hypothetical protein
MEFTSAEKEESAYPYASSVPAYRQPSIGITEIAYPSRISQ